MFFGGFLKYVTKIHEKKTNFSFWLIRNKKKKKKYLRNKQKIDNRYKQYRFLFGIVEPDVVFFYILFAD